MTDPDVEGFLALAAARLAPRTVDAYRRDLAALTAFLGRRPAAATADAAGRAPAAPAAFLARGRGAPPAGQPRGSVAGPRARGLSPATIARRTAALRSFYRHQALLGARRDNPAAALELPRRRRTLP